MRYAATGRQDFPPWQDMLAFALPEGSSMIETIGEVSSMNYTLETRLIAPDEGQETFTSISTPRISRCTALDYNRLGLDTRRE